MTWAERQQCAAMTRDSSPHAANYFSGWFETEEDSAQEFDRRIAESGLFSKVYEEVEGEYMSIRPGRSFRTPRIDRVLIPGARLRSEGWNSIIGVEIKRSGDAIGKAISQVLDYTWALFRLNGTFVYLDYIFIWPMKKQSGPIESVLAQNRIGEARLSRYNLIQFFAGGRSLIQLANDDTLEVRSTPAGAKVGSR